MRIAGVQTSSGVLAMLLAAFILSGCASTPEPAPTTASPTVAPVFATEEEALAAATEAYAAYQELADRILSEGGNDPSRITTVASTELASSEIESFERAQREGLRSVGLSSFDSVALQSFEPHAVRGEDSVSVYLCSDVSQVDIVDKDGESVVKSGRTDRTPFEVVFALGEDNLLVVSSRTAWTRSESC